MNKLDKFCYKFLRYGLLVAVFMPLVIFRNSFSPFNFGKVIVFRILVELLLVAYVWLAIRYKEFRIWNIEFGIIRKATNSKFQIPNSIFWALTLFTASYATSAFLGVNWHQSFWGYWERMGGLFTWLHFYVFLIILISVFKSKEDWLAILWLSVIAAAISTFYGFFQKFSVGGILGANERLRIFGTLGNPAAFAGYLLFNFYFALYLRSQFSNKKIRCFLAGMSVLFLMAIFMTAVRGAALALVISMVTYLFLDRRNLFKRINKTPHITSYVWGLIVLITSVFLLSPYLSKWRSFERLTDFSLNQPTVQQRITVWKIALNGIFDSSIIPNSKFYFGWGPENFSSVFSAHYDPEISKSNTEIFDKAHNMPLEIGSTQGLIGLLFWLFLMACLWQAFIQSGNYLFCSLTVAYLVHNLFFFDLFSSYLMFFILLGFGISTVGKRVAEGSLISLGSIRKLSFQAGMAVITTILSSALIFYANIKPALANFYTTRGYVLLYQGNGDTAFDYFDRAFSRAVWSEKDIYKKFSESLIDFVFRNKQFLKKEENQSYFKRLTDGLEKEVGKSRFEHSSYQYLYKAYRAEYLLAEGSSKKVLRSEELLKRGIKTLPLALPLYYELADFYIENKRYDDAIHVLEGVSSSAKDLSAVKFKLGAAFLLKNLPGSENSDSLRDSFAAEPLSEFLLPGLSMQNRNNSEFKKGLDLILEAINVGYYPAEEVDFLARSLEQNKRYPDLITFYLKLSEKNPQYFVHISYTYLLLGDRKNSKLFADKALALDYNQIGNQKLRLLADIYQFLGDNKKRSEALLKSAP